MSHKIQQARLSLEQELNQAFQVRTTESITRAVAIAEEQVRRQTEKDLRQSIETEVKTTYEREIRQKIEQELVSRIERDIRQHLDAQLVSRISEMQQQDAQNSAYQLQ